MREVEGRRDRELTDRELAPVNTGELKHAVLKPTEGPTNADLTSPFGFFAPFGFSCISGHRKNIFALCHRQRVVRVLVS